MPQRGSRVAFDLDRLGTRARHFEPKAALDVDVAPPEIYGAGLLLGAQMSEVLVVDDSKVMRDMVTACLRPSPELVVTHAASGLEAIEQLSLRAFDVVVLDLNMPDIGGLEVIEFVRRQDRLRALPILVVTTRGDDDSRSGALAAGASRYLTKPFAPDAILAEVLSLLGSERSG